MGGRAGELDLNDLEQVAPLGFVAKAVGKRALCILLADEHVDCFGVADLDECPGAHAVA